MGKNKNKHKSNKSFMSEWSSVDPCETIRFRDVLNPLKRILNEGYKIERYVDKTHFAYSGYNIGAKEQIYYPTPEERFSSRWLNNEAKFGRTLLDNIIEVAFHLGIEQGRRLDRPTNDHSDMMFALFEARNKTVHNLRALLKGYGYDVDIDKEIPRETDNPDLSEIENFDELGFVDAENPKEGNLSENVRN